MAEKGSEFERGQRSGCWRRKTEDGEASRGGSRVRPKQSSQDAKSGTGETQSLGPGWLVVEEGSKTREGRRWKGCCSAGGRWGWVEGLLPKHWLLSRCGEERVVVRGETARSASAVTEWRKNSNY